MTARKNIDVALVYDFDGTLSPGNMQEFGFVQAIGKDPEAFWAKTNELARKNDADEILCYMFLMLEEARANNISLRRESFGKFGSKIKLFKGVEAWFDMINEYGKTLGLNIKHYINSSGLREMIEGTSIAKHFENIYACSFLYNVDDVAYWPGVAVNYTTKTQFLFKINKGIKEVSDNIVCWGVAQGKTFGDIDFFYGLALVILPGNGMQYGLELVLVTENYCRAPFFVCQVFA